MFTCLAILAMLGGSALLTGRDAERWEKAGIISAAQGAAITAYEKSRNGKKLVCGLAGLALLAIALGILAIVAANWVHLSGTIKIAAHLALNGAVACAMWKAAREDKAMIREGATFLFFALNLTLIVLTGQVFHLQGNFAGAMAMWMLLSTPAVFLYGRTRLNAAPWTIAALVALGSNIEPLVRHAGETTQFLTVLGFGLFTPLACLAMGQSQALKTARPQWSQTMNAMGAGLLIVLASTASLSWYADMPRLMVDAIATKADYLAMTALCAASLAVVYGYAILQNRPTRVADRTGMLFVTGSLLSMILPLMLMSNALDSFAAVHFIAYWSFLGYIGYRLGHRGLVGMAIIMVALRLIVVYLELFGSLLSTGFGLLGGGIVMLLALKLTHTVVTEMKDASYEGGRNDW